MSSALLVAFSTLIIHTYQWMVLSCFLPIFRKPRGSVINTGQGFIRFYPSTVVGVSVRTLRTSPVVSRQTR
jgi:hypothetical protein